MNLESRLILLPSDPEFYEILNGNLPLDFDGSQCVVQRAGSGVLETVSYQEAYDYGMGGEYDEVDDDEVDFEVEGE